MHVLVVENYADTGLGQVSAALDEAGAVRDLRRPYAGDTLPDSADGHDALILLGGAQNALDDANHPWFPRLMDLVRDFEQRDRAVLGICLGAQLLARTFGGQNHIGGHREFGWQRVKLDEAAGTDPVFAALPSDFPIFQWHDDSFSLPPTAVPLATGTTVANQAFRIGRAVYATQFHFEADRKLVEQWSATFAPLIAEREADWPERRKAQAATDGPAADAAGMALARAWVAAIAPERIISAD